MSGNDMSDYLISWSELVSGQASDLWAVGLGFLVAQILIVASFISSKAGRGLPAVLVLISAFCSGVSLLFGYFVKGAVIVGIEKMMKPDMKITLPDDVSFYALVQLIFLVGSILIFLVTFGFYRKIVSNALLGK
jgi:hypothetical protein